MGRKELSNMSKRKYTGIRRALKLAELTGQSVNVGLNRAGEGVKIEGVIEEVYEDSFRIQLETGGNETVDLSEAEYVEYS
jgi:hypothetical protein